MGEVSTIGLDIAKLIFQIHGVDAERISRAKLLEFFAALPACLVGIEACPTAHHWSRQHQALGHTKVGMARQDCSRLLPTSRMVAFRQPRGSVWAFLLANIRLSGQRSWRSRNASMPGTARVRRAGGWRKSLVLARSSLPH